MSSMKTGFVVSCVLLTLILMVTNSASPEIPKKINYQGKLSDSATGDPLAGTHSMVFRVYDDPTGGSLLWTESQTVSADSAGVFSAVLGAIAPIYIAFDRPVWLEVEVGGEILSPRREIVSVPFAFRARYADHAGGADSLGGYVSDDFIREGEISVITSEMIADGTGSDLDADLVDGLNADAFADTSHVHDDRYYTQASLSTPGTVNDGTNPVDWTKLKGVPDGFADGSDDVGGAGDGHSLDAADGIPVDAVYVDNEGNVGIGTTSPSERLHLSGQASRILLEAGATDPEITLGLSGDAPSDSWKIYKERGTGALRFAQGGDRVAIAHGTGNVGIGTSPAGAERLNVGGIINLSEHISIDHTRVFSVEGNGNTFVGSDAGANNTGHGNTFVGTSAGWNNSTGTENVFVGDSAGVSNTDGWYNVFVGKVAGWVNTGGSLNSFVGAGAGAANDEGSWNTFVGPLAGVKNIDANSNTFVGMAAGAENTSGAGNVCVGRGAGGTNSGGSNNTCLGSFTGPGGNGSGNVLIGYQAGSSEAGSNKLYIANGSDPGDVLIYGDFSTGRLGLGTLDPAVKLDVHGDVNADSLYRIGGTRVLSSSGPKNLAIGVGANVVNGGRKVTCVGDSAGFANDGALNTFVGALAGRSGSLGNANTFVGAAAGYTTTLGAMNTFIGEGAGYDNQSGDGNTFVGKSAGYNNKGDSNTFVGLYAGLENDSGYDNTFIGVSAGLNNISGYGNTCLGRASGGGNETGSRNVCIGYAAGYYATGSDKLYIANGSGNEDVLIYGDFSNGRIGLGTTNPQRNLHIAGDNPRVLIEAETVNPEINLKHAGDANSDVWAIYKEGVTEDLRFYQGGDKIIVRGGTGNVGIGGDPMGTKFYVNGTSCGTSDFFVCSDLRFKRDIRRINDALGKVLSLRGVAFAWKTDEYSEKNFEEGDHYGVIAQETEEVLPEVVIERAAGEKAVAYTQIIPVLIEAIKTQQGQIDDLRVQVQELQDQLSNR